MHEYRLTTPEAVDIEYDIAGIGSRFLAAAIDTLIQLAALSLIGMAALILVHGLRWAGTVAAIIALTGSFVVFWGYYIYFETVWHGRTPGKQALRVRVIGLNGYPIGFGQAAIRNVVRFVDFLPGLYGLGVVVMFTSRQSRRLGDYAAGTIVVRERSLVELWDVVQTPQSDNRMLGLQPGIGDVDPEETTWALDALTAQDVQVMRDYLDRANALPETIRVRLGESVSDPIAERIGARKPLDAAAFLRRVLYLREHDTP